MQINRTASYSPSYTANYAEADIAIRLAATRVSIKAPQKETATSDLYKQSGARGDAAAKIGQRLEAKA